MVKIEQSTEFWTAYCFEESTLIVVSAFAVFLPSEQGLNISSNKPVYERELLVNVSPEAWTAIFTAGLFFATAALFIATYALFSVAARESDKAEEALKIARESAEASKQSAIIARDTLIASHRAWIRADVSLDSSQCLQFTPTAIAGSINVSFGNIGNNLASEISFKTWLMAEIPLDKGKPHIALRHKERCAEERQHQKEGSAFGNFSLFPGERFPDSALIGGYIIQATMDKSEADEASIEGPSGRCLMLYVGGCINYKITTDSAIHQTSFLYRVEVNNAPGLLRYGVNVAQKNLRLGALIFGDGRQAD